MRISELAEGSRPNVLLNGVEGFLQGLKILFAIGLAVLIFVGGVFVLHFSDETISGEETAYKPNPVEPIYQLELGEENQFLVLRTRQHLLFRDIESGELLESLPALPHIVATSRWIPNSRKLIFGFGDGQVAILSQDESWEMQYTPHIHRDDIRSIAVSSDGRLAVSGSSDRLCLWDLDQRRLLAETDKLKCSPDSMQFSPDQSRIVAGTDNGKIMVIQTEDLKVQRTINLGPAGISEAAFFENGEKVLAGNLHGGMFALDANTGETLWKDESCRLHMITLTISPDQSFAAFTDWTDNIHLLSLKTFERIDSFVGHQKAVSSVQFSRDGKKVFSASYDGTVRIWDVNSFGELDCYRGTLPGKDE
ncbi:MAG: PQQ-binding-like beta-propeller repeat protein [Planctomycetaceae bacterium]|nr:PQQ-binding-like beta-propeller repeat protein [Planctomycetaceae bacterium]